MFELESKDKWMIDRWGKFTSSENGKLFSPGKSGELFGAGAKTYIHKKALERMITIWERPEDEFNKNFFHGKSYERPAYEEYILRTRNHSMRYLGSDSPLFLEDEENIGDSGGSPDGIMGEEAKVYAGLELKCPRNPQVHLDYLDFEDQYDLQAYDPLYYIQVQDLLRITGAEIWHWCSYDERFLDKKMRFKLLEISPDRKVHDNLRIRLKMAAKKRDEYIDQKRSNASK